MIAPYWADVDTRKIGRVFYRQTTEPSLLARATSEITSAFNATQNITITALVIATWYTVGYFELNANKVSLY